MWKRKGTPYQRVMFRTQRRGDCLEWTGTPNSHGYGAIRTPQGSEGAHRTVWKHHHGAIPKGMYICHHCDNPPCVEIDHLFMGTNRDNQLDYVRKGLNKRLTGELSPSSKLTWGDVTRIRHLLARGDRQVNIAKLFAVSDSAIRNILKRRNWREEDREESLRLQKQKKAA